MCRLRKEYEILYKQENIHISSTEFQVRQGSEFTTTIYIADNANIIDFEVLLKYDTDKLTLISATENEDIKGAVVINAETAGSIGINYSRTSGNVNKQTMLVDLTFHVDEYLPAGVYDCLTVDTSGSYVAHRLVNGLLEEVDFNCEFAPLSIYEIGDVDLNNKVDMQRIFVVTLQNCTLLLSFSFCLQMHKTMDL